MRGLWPDISFAVCIALLFAAAVGGFVTIVPLNALVIVFVLALIGTMLSLYWMRWANREPTDAEVQELIDLNENPRFRRP